MRKFLCILPLLVSSVYADTDRVKDLSGVTFVDSDVEVTGRLVVDKDIVVSTISASSMTATYLAATTGTVNSFMLVGTTTNDNAPTGRIGEYISSSVDSVSITTTNSGEDITSISLTPGDWDVTGMVTLDRNTATWSSFELFILSVSGNSFTGNDFGINYLLQAWASSATTPVDASITIANTRVSISTTTTIYLKVRALFSAGNPLAFGGISARRVR